MKLQGLIKEPYPFYYQGRSLWVITAIVFLFTVSFYYLFEPFNVNAREHKLGFFWVSIVHGIVPAVIFPLLGLALKLNTTIDEDWNLGKELLFYAAVLLLVGVGQFLIRDLIYLNKENWSYPYLIEEVKNTYSIGVVFVIMLTLVNYNRLTKQNLLKARVITDSIQQQETATSGDHVFIKTQVKADDFDLVASQLVFARADRNYMEIFIAEEGEIRKELKRITTKEFEQQLATFDYIFKSHRSYIVNLNHIKDLKGNAQGYYLSMQGCQDKIPVSRNLIPNFESKMKK